MENSIRKYYLRDVETDTLREVSKESHDRLHAMMRQINQPLKDKGIGQMMVVGTFSDENDRSMQDLWEKSDWFETKKFETRSNYKLIPYTGE